jgi:hypothetical protein
MSMSNRLKALLLSSAIALSVSNVAQARNYEPHGEAAYTGVVYEIHLISGDQAVDPAILKADLDYVRGMREHHAGALTMSEDYLAKGASPVLRGMANAIITNQRFEIAVLDEVRRHVERECRKIGGQAGIAVWQPPLASRICLKYQPQNQPQPHSPAADWPRWL